MNLSPQDDDLLINKFDLPDDIFTRIDDEFYSFVKLVAGDCIFNILRIQLINSATKLLNTADVFGFFQVESTETDDLKAACCLKSKTGQYIIKPGIQTDLKILVTLLKQKLQQQQQQKLVLHENKQTDENFISIDFINKYPLLKSLIKWYKQNDMGDNDKPTEFLTSFIDNLVHNLTQSSNNYRYTDKVKNFAICLYILGGKQSYEFVRLNLPGSLPNLTTVNDLINQSNITLTEAEFRFDSLQQFRTGYGFCSEDATGVIRKVEYDSATNSFIGFTTPVNDGVPLIKHFQADKFEDLKMIYDTNEPARLLNVHMFQSISTENSTAAFPKPLILSAYGICNKFTAIDVLRRWLYIFENCFEKGIRVIGFSTGKLI